MRPNLKPNGVPADAWRKGLALPGRESSRSRSTYSAIANFSFLNPSRPGDHLLAEPRLAGSGRPPTGGRTSRKVCTLLLALLVAATVAPAAKLSEYEAADWLVETGGSFIRAYNSNIVEVDLTSTWVTDADLEKLVSMPHLRKIDLSYTWITDIGLEHLKPLENVEELTLHYTENITDGGIAHIKHWKNLKRLDVRGTKVTSRVFEHVGQIKTLEFLDVGFSRVTDDGFEHLADLTNLESLGFAGNKMSGVALPLLKLLLSLKHLDIGGRQRTDSGLWGLALSDFNLESIESLTGLESLNLQDATITDLGVSRLAALVNLESLDLSRTPVSGRGVKALAALPKLRRLKLWHCERVGDEVAAHLPALKKVEVLDLAETAVSDKTLEAAGNMPGLKQLFVGGTEVTAEAAESFRAERPRIQVTWWKTVSPPEPGGEDKSP